MLIGDNERLTVLNSQRLTEIEVLRTRVGQSDGVFSPEVNDLRAQLEAYKANNYVENRFDDLFNMIRM